MSNRQNDEDIFLQAINDNYESLKRKMKVLTGENWDEDVFSDTILKCYDLISKNGMKDNSEKGCLNYFFKAFIRNIRREKNYARNRLTSKSDDMSRYKIGYESGDDKILKDLRQDFEVFYILNKAAEHFDEEEFHLFQLKMLTPMTYKQLKEHTEAKAIKEKVSAVKKWLIQNVTKEEIDKAFEEFLNE